MADTIKEFLVSLGWKIDQSGAKKAEQSMRGTEGAAGSLDKTLRVVAQVLIDIHEKMLGAGAGAAAYRAELSKLDAAQKDTGTSGTNLTVKTFGLKQAFDVAKIGAVALTASIAAIGTAVIATANSYSKLYYRAQNNGTTVARQSAYTYAIKQAGGDQGQAEGSIEGLANFRRANGRGADDALRRFGVDPSKLGNDNTAIVQAIIERTRGMQQAQALRYLELFHVSQDTMLAQNRNPGQFNRDQSDYGDIYKRLGTNQDDAAKRSAELMRQVNRLLAALGALRDKVLTDLQKAFGGNLDDLTNYLLSHSDQITAAIKQAVDIILEFIKWVIESAKQVNKLVEETVGWKTALEAAFALFAVSKVIGIVNAIKLITTTFGALRIAADFAGASIARVLAKGAVKAGGAVAAEVEATGGGAILRGLARWGIRLGPLGTALAVAQTMYGGGLNKNESGLLQKRNMREGMSYLLSQGVDKEHAAAILGNLQQESGLNPFARNGSHVGIEQWDAERQQKILAGTGIDVKKSDFLHQLAASLWEIRHGSEKANGDGFFASSGSSATGYFADHIERSGEHPGDAGYDARVKNANSILSHWGDTGFGPSVSASQTADTARAANTNISTSTAAGDFNQTNHITVTGASDPAATAKAIGSQQDRLNNDWTRRLAAKGY